jgi:aldose sugar dehydrogenase
LYILTFGLIIFVCAFSVISTQFIDAEPIIVDSSVKVELVISGLSSPTSMAFVDPQNLLVLEKNSGEVRLVSNGELKEDPVLKLEIDSTTSTCCRGLLGIAIDNQNATSSKDVFLYFTAAGKDSIPPVNKIVKYKWDGSNLINSQIILELPATPGPNHPGGKLVLDADGNMYAVIGDLNNEGMLQNIEDSKELSDSSVIIKVKSTDGSALTDNPFVSIKKEFPTSQVDKYYGYGIRNSFGLAVDPVTGNLWDTENGDRDYDEINLVYPGFNSGWKQLMGPISESNIKEKDLVILSGSYYGDPVFSLEPSLGITDIEFFNSKNLGNNYENNIFVGDINNGNIYYFKLNDSRTGFDFGSAVIEVGRISDEEENDKLVWGNGFDGITDLETGPDGNLYILTFDESSNGDGKIYRILSK